MKKPTHQVRIIICGDRRWTDYELIKKFVDNSKNQIELLIEGEAPGADSHARNAAMETGIENKIVKFPAEWNKYGRAAGLIRNQQMLDFLLRYDGKKMVFAFHDNLERSKGTKHMLKIAKKAGVQVETISHSIYTETEEKPRFIKKL